MTARKILCTGYRAGDVRPPAPDEDVTYHVLDIYDLHAIEKTSGAKAVCSADLPDGQWDEIRFRTGPKLMGGELSLDVLQQAYAAARRLKCRVALDYVGRERDRNDLLAKVKDDPDRIRSFRAVWPASVPGGPRLEFVSYPGCFCHRRLDEGGLALAETVCRDLSVPRSPFPVSLSLLDMGCGCGLVGLLIATAARAAGRPLAGLTMVDSHSRAVRAAAENAERFGEPASVVLSDCGAPPETDGTFDVFVGNPPYYSEYRIAETFLDAARRALKPGGACYTVCKNAAGLEPVQRKWFPDVEIVRRRGYAVLKSVKA